MARAQNLLPTLTKAYDDVLDKYDVIIMPTTICKARKLPPKGADIKGEQSLVLYLFITNVILKAVEVDLRTVKFYIWIIV